MIGGSDAGAHLDMMCGAIYTTSLLGHGAREHQVVTLEEALRWEPPISTVVRAARRRCGLGGIAIPAGTSVSVSVAAASRDPEQNPEPDGSTRRGRTSRSDTGAGRMCASECRRPGWRRRWRSTPCSTGCPTYTSTQQRHTSINGVAFRSPGFAIKLSRGELEPVTGLRPTLPPETMGNGRLRERPGVCRAQ